MTTRHTNPTADKKPPIRLASGPCGTALRALADSMAAILPTRFDYWERDYRRCPDILNSTEPDLVDTLYREYLRAGSEILISNTFLSNSLLLPSFNLKGFERSLTREGIHLAHDAARAFFDIDNAAGQYGPDRSISIAAPLAPLQLDSSSKESLETARSIYRMQIQSASSAAVDEIFLETITDAKIARQAAKALADFFVDSGKEIPLHISFTLGTDGRLPSGQTLEQALDIMGDFRYASAGINCVFTPQRAAEEALRLAELTPLPISLRPSAALSPDRTPCSPAEFAAAFKPLILSRRLAIAGACCNATPRHIASLRRAIDAESGAEAHLNLQSKLN